MFRKIPIPKGSGPGDFLRLRSHALWYKKQIEKFGPGYGSKSVKTNHKEIK